MPLAILFLFFILQGEGAFGTDPIWNDGQAEVATYKAREHREGHWREFTANSILVKETLDPAQLVKSDDPGALSATLEVLKWNWLLSVPTGMATHNQMATVFFRQKDMNPVKLTLTHHEWCGNSFKIIERDKNKFKFRGFTYWDGMAEVRETFRGASTLLFYDALPVRLRAMDLEQTRRLKMRLVPTQVSGRAPKPRVEDAELLFEGKTGEFLTVRVKHGRGEDRLWFSSDGNHVMTKWIKSNGSSYELLKVQRSAYWNKTADSDRELIPRSGG